MWAFIKQVFTRCFPFYGTRLNQLLKIKWSVQPISASQSLMTNQYLSIDDIQSIRRISSRHFLFSHNPSQFNIFNEWMTPDCLLHNLLIAKLAAYGFDYDSLVFIQSYLSERQQRTKVNTPTTLILTYYMVFHKILY